MAGDLSSCCPYLVSASITSSWHWRPAYGWLFIGRVIAGITGASFTTATAYIADISPDPTTRAKNFGMIGAAFGLGFVLGPALGGLLAGWGIRAPFYAAAGLCLMNCLYGYFLLPESLPKRIAAPSTGDVPTPSAR